MREIMVGGGERRSCCGGGPRSAVEFDGGGGVGFDLEKGENREKAMDFGEAGTTMKGAAYGGGEKVRWSEIGG